MLWITVVLCVTALLLSERWRSAWLRARIPPAPVLPRLTEDRIELPRDLEQYVQSRWSEEWAQDQQRVTFMQMFDRFRDAGNDPVRAWDKVRQHGIDL